MRLSRLTQALAPGRRAKPDPAFDPSFYQNRYADLRGMPTDALWNHYDRHGRAEGRFRNAAEARAADLDQVAGLEPDPAFDPDFYRERYPDLTGLRTSEQLLAHYVQFGRAEGRFRNRDEEFAAELGPSGDDPAIDPLFDAEFYRAHYADMTAIVSPELLLRHYQRYGRQEGRRRNLREAVAALERQYGYLPPGFDGHAYWLLHEDLRSSLHDGLEATEHYLRVGRKQKRAYIQFDPDLYRDMYFREKVITDYELELHYKTTGRAEGRIGSWSELIEGYGVTGRVWLRRFKRDEFELLNWSWTGPLETKLDAVRRFIEEGVARLAPIAFDLRFEPDYYREVHPEYADLDDEALYRTWLFKDLERDWAGSPEVHLRQLGLALSAYPAGFDWLGYARSRGLTDNRWFVLQQLLERGLSEDEPVPTIGPSGAAFALALGLRFRGAHDDWAIRAFEEARRIGDDNYATAHHLGDAYLRSEQWSKALACFQEAARNPNAELWTYVNGAKAAVKLGAYGAAFDLLRAGRGWVSGEPVWRDAVHDTVEAWFGARSKRARQLYHLEGGRERADRLVPRLVDRASALWSELDPIGAPVGPSPQRKVVILAGFDIRVCVHYRVEQKEEMFEALGQPYEVYRADQWKEFIAALPGAAAAIFFRLPAWPTVTRAMEAARRMEVPTYYEIDDLIFDSSEYPDTLESYGGLLSWADYEAILFGVPLFRSAIERCDYGIVSTNPLGRAVAPLVRTGQVFWIPNGLDSRNEHYLYAPPERVRQDDTVWIAYASGTKAHNTDFNELAGPALLQVLKAHPNVRLLLVGYLALDPAFDDVREQIIRYDYVDNSESFWAMLADADISLAVLKPTWATDSKSEIKWLEAGVMGIPSVVSDTAVYCEVLRDGVDALIARDVEEWRAAIERLVTDPALRREIGRSARETAGRQYSVAANAERLKALLAPALDARRPVRRPAGAKRRILLGNVWFPPQTIGGATRVLRNNLDAWLDAGLDAEFEFAVVATDNNVAPPYQVRVEDYRGVPVMRISTPMRRNMDWRPEDHEVRRIFGDFLEMWRPDLVHFHAVQRLTASVLQACQRAAVPYLVTVHDAWWLSDWHFLVDDEGRRHEPCAALPKHPPTDITVSQSLDRRRVLRAALDGAEAVLGVSESFAELHRACGFDHVLAVPNGAPPLPSTPRKPSASGRVRLVHVGNIARHKGHHLVEAALKQSRFGKLELTVIDHARTAGSEEQALWGETPVRIIGKVPQEAIHLLYAQSDVLLAPSIWPESFGLVAREALSAGLWVVASDLGAMGEDVLPGQNGFVIDVSTVEGLLETLRTINADPERFLRSPDVRPTLRSSDRQAEEVMALYRRVLAGEKLFPGFRNRRVPFAGTMATDPAPPVRRKTEFALRREQRSEAGAEGA